MDIKFTPWQYFTWDMHNAHCNHKLNQCEKSVLSFSLQMNIWWDATSDVDSLNGEMSLSLSLSLSFADEFLMRCNEWWLLRKWGDGQGKGPETRHQILSWPSTMRLTARCIIWNTFKIHFSYKNEFNETVMTNNNYYVTLPCRGNVRWTLDVCCQILLLATALHTINVLWRPYPIKYLLCINNGNFITLFDTNEIHG